MPITRRGFTKLAAAAVPALAWSPSSAWAFQKINSKVNGVTLGAITYSFRSISDANQIVSAYVSIGLGEMEIMSNHVESLAGVPGGRAGDAARAEFRRTATEATFKPVRQKIQDAGIDLRLLCYNMNVRTTQDDEIEYAFTMAKGLGVKAISTSTQVSMAKRLAPFSNRHKIPVGFHGHADIRNPDEVATPESFEAVMATSKYHGANLDIGHYVEAGFDPIPFMEKHHGRITNLHIKDKKKATNGGGNTPWGSGDTPIKEVLTLLRKKKWDLPANIEFEYDGDPLVEMPKCLAFCREALK